MLVKRLVAVVLLSLFVIPLNHVASASALHSDLLAAQSSECLLHVADGDIAELIDAINDANNETTCPGPDTITLDPQGTYVLLDGGGNNTGLPNISSDILIQGNGSTITRSETAPNFRLFLVTQDAAGSGHLRLENVTLSNGMEAVWNYGTLTVTSTDFTQNTAAIVNHGTATISGGSTFYGNGAPLSNIVQNFYGALTISDSTFTNNQGTAIALTGGDVVISDVEITGSTGGHAVYTYSSAVVEITDSKFTNNHSGTRYGGAIFHTGTSMHLVRTTITGNSSTSGDGFGWGGGIYAGSPIVIEDSNISNNMALHRGGGLRIDSDATIIRTTISGNESYLGGGVAFVSAGTLTVTDSILTGNVGHEGGAVWLGGGTSIITNNRLEGNNATLTGSSVYIHHPPSINVAVTANQNCIRGNAGTSVFNSSATSPADFASNWWGASSGPAGAASGTGDSIGTNVIYSPYLEFPYSTCNETAECDVFNIPDGDMRLLRAAIVSANDEVLCPGEDIIHLPENGNFTISAAIAAEPPVYVSTSITIEAQGSLFTLASGVEHFPSPLFSVSSAGNLTLNNIQTDGNITALYSAGGHATVNSSTFKNNILYGRAIYSEMGSTITVNNSIFDNNHTGAWTLWGGASIYNLGSTIEISDSIFTNNVFTPLANVLGTMTLRNVTITDNTTSHAVLSRGGTLNVYASLIARNLSATQYGGAIQSQGAIVLIEDTRFIQNSNNNSTGPEYFLDRGGAILASGGTLVVRGSTFESNMSVSGGAIFLEGEPSLVIIEDSEFSGNIALNGGAIGNSALTAVSITGSSFVDNTSQYGGALSAGAGHTTLINNRFEGNTATIGGGAVFIANPMYNTVAVTANQNCITGNSDISVENAYAPIQMDMQENWWGASSGPSGAGTGDGDSVGGNIDYSGFLQTAPVGCATVVLPTAIPTATPTPTTTETHTSTPTSTSTPTATHTATETQTDIPTVTSSPSATNTGTDTPTATETQTDIPVVTFTPTATNTATDTPTPTETSTHTPTITTTATPSVTAIFTLTPIPSPADPIQLIRNRGFEGTNLNHWDLNDASNDEQVCGDAPDAENGDCYFRFRGNESESSALRQFADLSGLSFSAGDVIRFRIFYKSRNGNPDASATVRVTYANGETQQLSIQINQPLADYDKLADSLVLTRPDVIEIRVRIANRAAQGRLFIDSLSLTLREP